jgi:hypothetical protein
VYLGVEDVFGALEEVHVPDADDPVGLVYCRRVLVVGRDAELRVLRRPVSAARSRETDVCTFGDQSMSVIERLRQYRSSQNSHTRFTRFPSESSLARAVSRGRMGGRPAAPSVFAADGVVPDVVVLVVQRALHDLRRLLDEVEELGRRHDRALLLLRELCAAASAMRRGGGEAGTSDRLLDLAVELQALLLELALAQPLGLELARAVGREPVPRGVLVLGGRVRVEGGGLNLFVVEHSFLKTC